MKIKYWFILFLPLLILFFMKNYVEQFENADDPENSDASENSESAENVDPSIEGPTFNMCTCNSLCKLKNVGSDDIVRNIDCSLPMKAFSGTPQETTIYNKNHFCTLCNNIVKDKCRIRNGQEISDNDPIKRADKWCSNYNVEQKLFPGVLERCPSNEIVGGDSKWNKYKFSDAYPMVLVNYMLEKKYNSADGYCPFNSDENLRWTEFDNNFDPDSSDTSEQNNNNLIIIINSDSNNQTTPQQV